MSSAQSSHPGLKANIAAIHSIYDVPAQSFSVGPEVRNAKGENMGSLAILAFAKEHNLPRDQVLEMFAEAYHHVLSNPDDDSHHNIRAFGSYGLDRVIFNGEGIKLRNEYQLVEAAWEDRANLSSQNFPEDLRFAVETIIYGLDRGVVRVAMKLGGGWITNQPVKKAVLLSFRMNDNRVMLGGEAVYRDKVDLKFHKNLPVDYFEKTDIRVVPPAVARKGCFIAKKVVMMPSYINIAAYVDEGTMVDTWATIGSCAQIGKNCHISGGAGIGGVLEPVQNNPTIIEDNCFIGARSEVVEGVIVREGAVLSMGVLIGKNTPIVDRTKDCLITRGEVPSRAVVMMGVHPSNGLICPQIVKYRDEKTDAATAINELLRGD